jgi:hypothetical protein
LHQIPTPTTLLSLTSWTTCPNNNPEDAVDVAEAVEEDEANTEQAAEVVAEERTMGDEADTLRLESGQRRRIFSISANTWTRRSPSSLLADAKVRFPFASISLGNPS